MKKLKAQPSKINPNVTFRLDPVRFKKLYDEAAEKEVSHHRLAQEIVFQYLDKGGEERTFQKLIETLDEVRTLRGDLAEAVEWMVQNLKTK